MKWLFLIPAVVLAIAFATGFLCGVGVLLCVPYTRRQLAEVARVNQVVPPAVEGGGGVGGTAPALRRWAN